MNPNNYKPKINASLKQHHLTTKIIQTITFKLSKPLLKHIQTKTYRQNPTKKFAEKTPKTYANLIETSSSPAVKTYLSNYCFPPSRFKIYASN